MEQFLALSNTKRKNVLNEVSIQKQLSPEMIEKDFWVSWLLKQLFYENQFKEHLIFKGGTSLSKCYHAINRFSEDIDLSLSREALGITAEQEPHAGMTESQIDNRIKKIYRKARGLFQEQLLPDLESILTKKLAGLGPWSLKLKDAQKDLHTFNFRYPQTLENKETLSYLLPQIKIEISARAEHQPVEKKRVEPYISEVFSDRLSDSTIHLNTLAAERTFWEKATILHAEFHRPKDGKSKQSPPRLARHCYDLYQLYNSEIGPKAIKNLGLLEAVARHKNIFYPQIWANYQSAKHGTLHLYPHEDRIQEYQHDYELMVDYFYITPPSFDKVLACLKNIENEVNNR